MRYLIPSDGDNLRDEVARFFGSCKNFLVVFEEDSKVTLEDVVHNTYSGIDHPGENVAAFAASNRNINVVIAGNMVDSSRKVLEHAGLRVELGYNGLAVPQAIKKFLKKSGL